VPLLGLLRVPLHLVGDLLRLVLGRVELGLGEVGEIGGLPLGIGGEFRRRVDEGVGGRSGLGLQLGGSSLDGTLEFGSLVGGDLGGFVRGGDSAGESIVDGGGFAEKVGTLRGKKAETKG
jgi:hypothetical protein